MPRPQWTSAQARLAGRKGGLKRKGNRLRTPEYRAGYQAGWRACARLWTKVNA